MAFSLKCVEIYLVIKLALLKLYEVFKILFLHFQYVSWNPNNITYGFRSSFFMFLFLTSDFEVFKSSLVPTPNMQNNIRKLQ